MLRAYPRLLSPLGLSGLLLLAGCGGSDATEGEPPASAAGAAGKAGSGGKAGSAGKAGSGGSSQAGEGGAGAGGAGSGGAAAGQGGAGAGGAGQAGSAGSQAGSAGAPGGAGGAGQGGVSGSSGQGGAGAGSGQGGAGAGQGGSGSGGGAGEGGQGGGCGKLVECEGVCVDLLTDEKNCGLCGNACGAGEVCDLANCAASCPDGLELCSGVCVDTQSDGNNCGACGAACDKGTACSLGQCQSECPAGQQICGGSCVDTKTSANNCGSCGAECPAGPGAQPICQGGLCGFVCQKGYLSCNGACVDTQTDPANCGGCGKPCADGEACVAGACAIDCSAPKQLCGGVCTDTSSNAQNCGACGKACGAGEACVSGACEVVCEAGTESCGGACVDTQSDPKNCGACGKACGAGEVCSAGACKASCGAGQTLCGGVCVDTQTDAANCGGCGTACGATETCQGGTCQLSCKAQLLGNPLSDQWGFSWDGNERTTTTLAKAEAACGAIGGRLPTATELHRVSASRTSQVGQLKDINNLWTNVPFDADEQIVSRLSDGAITKQAVSKNMVYRCVCAPPDPPGFSGSDCTGSSKAVCTKFEREGKTYNIDSHDRAKLNAGSAAWECAFQGGHLLDLGTHIAAIKQDLPGGLGGMHWTSDVASSGTAMTVAWTNKVAWAADNNTISHGDLGNLNNTTFRCMGPADEPAAKASAPGGVFVVPRSKIALDPADRAAQKWAAAHDTCAFFGGHLPATTDLLEGIFEGLPGGSNTKLWTADQAGYNGTQFLAASLQWTAAAPRTSWEGAASWAYKNSTGQPFRCVYYPTTSYAGPDAAQCNGACFEVPTPVGSAEKKTSLWFDALDRPLALVGDAIADCHAKGGRLPRERDYTEAIRAGLPNGSTTLLFTSDFSLQTSNGTRRVQVVRWSQQEAAFDDQYSKYMTWSDLTTKRPYRCMWTGENRLPLAPRGSPPEQPQRRVLAQDERVP